jgi:uncharacterized membrane protein YdcZ (DUF606 family)
MDYFVNEIAKYISKTLFIELTSFLGGTFLFFLYFYSKTKIKAFIKNKDSKYSYLDLATRLVVLSIFYLVF